MKIGLSLSGGAARGLIHLGAMEELEKAGIRIDMVAGCSIGALIGAMYALDPNVESIKERIFSFLEVSENQIIPVDYLDEGDKEERRGIFKRMADSLRKSVFYGISLTKVSLLSGERLMEMLAKLVPDVEFSECKIPFVCGTTDITNKKAHYITSGSLLKAVAASCSIPGLYPPVKFDGMSLVDGSWTVQNHPDRLKSLGAGFVIAVNIDQTIMDEPEPSTGLEVVLRSNIATRNVLSDLQLQNADVIIHPDICDVSWWDFNNSKACTIKGRESTAEQINSIKRKILTARIKRVFL